MSERTLTEHQDRDGTYFRYGDYEIRESEISYAVGHSAVWSYVHDSYDGPGDTRCGLETSPEECVARIEEQYDYEEWRREQRAAGVKFPPQDDTRGECNGDQELAHQMELARRVK